MLILIIQNVESVVIYIQLDLILMRSVGLFHQSTTNERKRRNKKRRRRVQIEEMEIKKMDGRPCRVIEFVIVLDDCTEFSLLFFSCVFPIAAFASQLDARAHIFPFFFFCLLLSFCTIPVFFFSCSFSLAFDYFVKVKDAGRVGLPPPRHVSTLSTSTGFSIEPCVL